MGVWLASFRLSLGMVVSSVTLILSNVSPVVLVVLALFHGGESVRICEDYPSPDPCRPGGVWDPVLNSCSGYDGNACYQCYSGSLCKTKEDTLSCNFTSRAGNPVYLSEYWLDVSNTDPCTTTIGHYRPSYEPSRLSSHPVLPPLVSALHKVHSITQNAVTEGYYLVAGIGATMVINVAVAAMSKRMLESCKDECPDQVDVFAQLPYFSTYKFMMTQIPTARWNASADPNSPWTIEIVTYPNNPDGSKKEPLVKDPDRVIMDMVYYWPMYTNITKTLDKSIMIFSSSKHDGLAGTRFGWAWVRDQDLATRMWNVTASMIWSLSVDIELRILTNMQTALNQGPITDNMLPFHRYGQTHMAERFQRLIKILDGCSELTLLNSPSSTGAYAFVHCSTEESCADYLAKVNLYGNEGTKYGMTVNEVRFTMLLPDVEMEIFLEKIEMLCSRMI